MRVLVTGCSGFLGSEIVRQLLDQSHDVVGLSRRETPELVRDGMTHLRGDLCDTSYVNRAINDVQAVIHTAAVAGVWGPWKHFYNSNVVASRNVLAACQNSDVEQLVYTSSPSVTFDGEHQSGINETAGYPDRWLCYYPQTKAIAEQEILAADHVGGLRTVSLRPHLIWGPNDPHLLPRLLDRARKGRLRIVGDGQNIIDTVHVANAAAAHLAAINALGTQPDQAAGRAYFITQDEPVNCWDWIAKLCESSGVEPPRKKISFNAAYALGRTLEGVFGIARLTKEPPMTRFVAAQLAKDHYFDITAAKERLGYQPHLSMDAGLEQLFAGSHKI